MVAKNTKTRQKLTKYKQLWATKRWPCVTVKTVTILKYACCDISSKQSISKLK